MMKILYFAWVRERIGKPEEDIELPGDVKTPADLLAFLRTRGPEYESAFAEPDVIRVAADQTHVEHDMPITDAREIALFPPMTGG
ncbi:molybdopterin converting factor subunit 1 [Breoghania sp.]|uniref:molybdopterin converting factor subunit 1 n=1 Tax=Breoghania sp. TaxID=2065378 RepID=UPI002AAB6A61|nr:molybdopterin converting factor subunit 1 [Breoghania sp.]